MPSFSIADKVTIEVRRAAGLDRAPRRARRLCRRDDPAARRLRRVAADSRPSSAPPDPLVDAMQTGDRLGYHPEAPSTEIAHFHQVLPRAQAAVDDGAASFVQRLNDSSFRIGGSATAPADVPAERQRRLDLLHRAEALVAEAAK